MKKLFLLLIILLAIHSVYSQNWRIRANTYITTSNMLPLKYFEGISLSGLYSKKIGQQNNRLYGGITFNTNSWSNHVLAKLGYSYKWKTWTNWSFSQDIEIGNGIALFTPNPLYTFDFVTLGYFNFHTAKENSWGIGVGIQLITTPGYKTFSSIYSQYNLPISFRYCF